MPVLACSRVGYIGGGKAKDVGDNYLHDEIPVPVVHQNGYLGRHCETCVLVAHQPQAGQTNARPNQHRDGVDRL